MTSIREPLIDNHRRPALRDPRSSNITILNMIDRDNLSKITEIKDF